MIKTLIISALTASIAFSSPLSKQAQDSGLIAIPSAPSALLKLIDNPKNPITKQKVELGKMLYMEPRLSKSGIISCNTCHNLGMGGVDGVSAAIGHKWAANPHGLNSPTVYNAVFFDSQFWDGRDPDLEKQAQGPIQAGPEMAATQKHVVDTVVSMPEYVSRFQKAYGKDVKIDFEKVTDTIALFERTLVTPAPFDAYLEGDENALNAAEKKGLKTFMDKGCATCHNGIALGGSMQMFPLVSPYKYANMGDFKGDKNGMVKVPTLRNITETTPYFHNGAIFSLKEAIQEMGRTQLGMEINDADAASIETFLGALEGKKPTVTYPQLPNSTATTPQPDMN